MAISLMHCNQVKSVSELTAFTFICDTVHAFLMGGAASAPLAEVIATLFFLTSRQVTQFAPFPTTFVRLATYKAKNRF